MKAFIDTNVFIYALEKHPEFGEKAKSIMEKVDEEKIEASTSTLVIEEVCWYLEGKKRIREMLDAVKKIIKSKLEIIPVLPNDLLEATKQKQKFKEIEFNDLINYTVMKRKDLKLTYSNDEHLDRLPRINREF